MKTKLFFINALLLLAFSSCEKPVSVYEDADVKHLVSNVWYQDWTGAYSDMMYHSIFDEYENGDSVYQFRTYEIVSENLIKVTVYFGYGKDAFKYEQYYDGVDYTVKKLEKNRLELYLKTSQAYGSRVVISENKFYIDVNSDNYVITTVIYKSYYEDTGEIIDDYGSFESTYTIAPQRFADEIRKL